MKFYSRRYDKENGGFGSAPKFPTPVNLLFLLELAALKPKYIGEPELKLAEEMAITTLKKMALGGIHG